MINFYKMMFFNTMILGTLISISAYSWMSMWMGLEINLLSIIPLFKNKSTLSSEATLKYFITQALASLILLFSIIMMMMMTEFIPQNFNLFLLMIMNSSLLTKMGAAPFHFWFPEVMEGLSWINCFILLTWQKIAPMILLMYNYQMPMFLFSIIILSMLISGIMGLNQTSLRKIMTFSSINHIGWMLSTMFNNQSIWMIYFIIYSIISLNIILIFNFLNIFYLHQLYSKMNYNISMKLFFIMNFLSLGGLPPFLGFLPKWMTINYLINENLMFLAFIMIILTLITLFYYIRITFSTLTLNSSENLMLKSKIKNFPIMMINTISLLSIIICTMIFNLM
uniref:NADH-ubiquinone oxidoreductase chain 2 n=1 Tax=Dastarcus helophoroides TaxID=1169899 RepID=A0A059SX05_9CUCU|nr:NADH dehydrogenase subunit 2 [Dastarcus helophoroides]AHG24991.1 NADH dehydrogenase subunit 2 [Dastarcus helophoroides]